MEDRVKFGSPRRKYTLDFNKLQLIQLIGKSASGKSLMVQDIAYYGIPGVERGRIKIIDVNTPEEEVSRFIRGKGFDRYELVVIDNADVVLNDEDGIIIKEYVYNGGRAKWVIIGRNICDYTISTACLCKLSAKKVKTKDGFILYEIENDRNWLE